MKTGNYSLYIMKTQLFANQDYLYVWNPLWVLCCYFDLDLFYSLLYLWVFVILVYIYIYIYIYKYIYSINVKGLKIDQIMLFMQSKKQSFRMNTALWRWSKYTKRRTLLQSLRDKANILIIVKFVFMLHHFVGYVQPWVV